MGKVLFIDDNIGDFKPLLMVVTKLIDNVEILAAEDGLTGLKLALEKKPDVIFLDIKMPGIDGFEVCKRLKASEETKKIPVLFFTSAEIDLSGQLSAIDMGAEDFLHKPINAVELAARIKIMLRLKEHTDHLERLVAEQTKKADEQRALAARAERLASLGTLAAGIAHEINQPLNALKVSVDGALYWKDNNKEISSGELFESLQFISDQANRIDDIIKHMRSLAKHEDPQVRKPINANEIIDRALSLIEKQIITRQISIEKKYQTYLPVFMAQPTQIEQVIINLTINAKNALTSVSHHNKKITISTYTEDNYCVIEVKDNGPGIPPDQIENVFDPFFTTKFTQDGMGLGLTITQNIVKEFDGRLIAGNNSDGGACFKVLFPASK